MTLTESERRLITKVAKGLLAIAEQAMPDTYVATDSRVKTARTLLKALGEKPR